MTLPRMTEPAEPLVGSVMPRIFTPPLVDVDDPRNSFGYDVIDFADRILGTPLDPWQRWAVIRVGELLPDGRPRFRTVLILVARQRPRTGRPS